MAYDNETLNRIYDRTDGRCHICGKKLGFVNYASPGRRGAWEVDHSNARANGGSDYLRNLLPACVSCNREKGTRAAKTARAWHGRKRAPLSKEKKTEVRQSKAVTGGILGALIGLMFGPWGMVFGGVLGAKLGYDYDPEAQ